jgi:hypothetical protein
MIQRGRRKNRHGDRQIGQWVFARSGKVLNLRRDSKRRSAVTFLAIAQNKFINRLRLSRAERSFRTGEDRYADK